MTMYQSLRLVAGFGWWPIATTVLVAACALMHWGRRDRTAWSGLAALGGAAAAIVLLRWLVLLDVAPFAALGLRWPSGHAALAAVVYGTLGFVYGRHLPAGPRGAAQALCGALIVAVPSAMVGLGFHTVTDVLVGGAAGFAALATSRVAAAWVSARSPPPRVSAQSPQTSSSSSAG
jgi:membrane-associated phospholipid phosphatase